jgi:hypothetical protein
VELVCASGSAGDPSERRKGGHDAALVGALEGRCWSGADCAGVEQSALEQEQTQGKQKWLHSMVRQRDGVHRS